MNLLSISCMPSRKLLISRRVPLLLRVDRNLSTSSSSSFFTYTSGRARRKRELQYIRRQKKQQWNHMNHTNTTTSTTTKKKYPLSIWDTNHPNERPNNKEDIEDTRTIQDILFPNPYKDQPDPYSSRSILVHFKNWTLFRQTLSMTWIEYKRTWDGFFTSKGFLVEDNNNNNNTPPPTTPTTTKQVDGVGIVIRNDEIPRNEMEQIGTEIQKNVQRNVTFLQQETETLQKVVQERTGIRSTNDLKELAREMMRLATDCVGEFLAGYRKGRDDEVDKMLTKYFQELQEKVEKPIERKRRVKRRVLTI